MSSSTTLTSITVALAAGLPGAASAHSGHGGGSALQHNWEHALWLGAGVTVFTCALWAYRQYRNRSS